MTTMTEQTTTHPRRARRRPDLRHPRRRLRHHAPVLLLIGSPMGAGGFGTLAGHFPDRTVVTYDPRGVERSTKADPSSQSTPEQHADDLHRIIAELGTDPVDIFASSGGAVNALALVAAHPEEVRTLVAHEPPLASILPDREGALAACRGRPRHVPAQRVRRRHGAVHRRRRATRADHGPDFASQPAPDPAMFGLPAEDDGTRTDALLGQNIITCTHYEPDFDALRAASTRIVLAAGVESEGQLAQPRRRTPSPSGWAPSRSIFPSDHGGFLGGEYGQTGDPDAFAAKLREVLAGA